MRKNRKKPSITIVVTAFVILSQLMVAGFGTLIAGNYVREGIERGNQTRIWMLENYISQIDREMDMAASYMNAKIYQNHAAVDLTSRERPEFYYAANRLNREIRQNLMDDQYVSGMYYYVPSTEFEYTCFKDAQTLSMAQTLRDYIFSEYVGESRRDADWKYVELDGVPFLIQGYTSSGFYGGCLVNLTALPLPDASVASNAVFADLEQMDAVKKEHAKTETILEARSQTAPFGIYERIDEKEIWSALPFQQRYAFFMVFGLILFMVVLYVVLTKFIVFPLRRLDDAMKRIREGNLDYRIEEISGVAEFAQTEQAFNQMTRQIRDLKIEVYEKQLEQQKTKLQNLSYQLRPHFMVNSLNMVYNLILSEDKKNALKLIRFSVGYLRYLLKREEDMVPLGDEIRHLENYLNIQQLRYENQFGYTIEVDPFVSGIRIPSMLLQNFAENSIKYSINPSTFTQIRIRIGYLERNGVPSALLEVADNGMGYPEWLLKAVQEEDYEALEERIGLKNNLMRMKMMFGEQGSCEFANENGAVVRFVFPIDFEVEDEE